MNRITVTLLSILFFSCLGKHGSKAQKATITKIKSAPSVLITGDTINVVKSNIRWKGTKMRGAGKHEGEIELKNGYFIKNNGQLLSGNFLVDMTTINVNDIPEHEPVPRNNLNNHLKSSDFFEVKKFPTSKLQLTNVKRTKSDSLLVSANLTLKDSTKHIQFLARYQNDTFSTKFTIDRFQWNIAYTGNWTDRTLVDKDIEMKIVLVME